MPVSSPFPSQPLPETVSLPQLVLQKAAQHGSISAMVEHASGKTLTFQQIVDNTTKVAAALYALGVRQNDIIFVLSTNCFDSIIAFLSVTSLGAIVTSVNPLSTEDELLNYWRDCKPTRLIVHSVLAAASLRAANTYGDFKDIIVMGEAGKHRSFKSLYHMEAPPPPNPGIVPKQQVATILYSSGTTGKPKGVLLTHYMLVTNLLTFSASFEDYMGERPRYVSLFPLFHASGVAVILHSIIRGDFTVLLTRFDLDEFLRVNQDYKMNILYVSPPLVALLVYHPAVTRYDLTSVRYVGCGADVLSPELASAATRRLKLEDVMVGYGMTEFGPVVTVTIAGKSKPGSSGFLIANVEGKVISMETGQEVGRGCVGELWLRGPCLMGGYLNNPSATAAAVTSDGWYKTGDIGYFDEEGHLFIVDRLKDIIKYKGYQVAPSDLEDLLKTHPAVADAAVVGRPDLEAGELPCAYVQLRPGATVSKTDLQHFVAGKVSPHKKLRGGVQFVTQLPKSATGKLLRRELRARGLGAAKLTIGSLAKL